jgi:hypothetical protein
MGKKIISLPKTVPLTVLSAALFFLASLMFD